MTSSSTSASAKSRSVTATAHMDQTMRMSTRASAATSARLIRQSGRLDEIRDNLRLQVEEAQRNRWLGDVAQLRLTIQHADRKAEKLMVRSRGNPELVVAESAGRNADFVGFSDVAAKPAWHRVYGINRRLCRVDGAWASLGGGGVKDWPPNFGAPGRFVAGVLWADEEVLANRAIDADRVLGDVGGQGAVGQVEVAIRAGVHHGGQFGGWYHEFGEASGRSEITAEGDENGRLPSFAGD